MYYEQPCSHCGKIFFVYSSNKDKESASKMLYHAIKKHLKDYNEDHKETKYDDGEYYDSQEIAGEMKESPDAPEHAYEVK